MSLKGKKLLILAGVAIHCKVVEAAKALGVHTIVTDYLENLSDESTSIIRNIEKYLAKKQDTKLASEKLLPYMQKVMEFYGYVIKKLETGLSTDQRVVATKMEDEIDEIQKVLKKSAKKRLEEGGDVKSQLRYIDIVRRIENAGDSVYDLVRVL